MTKDIVPVIEASRLDLHTGEHLAEEVEKLALHLITNDLAVRLGIGIEEALEHGLRDDVVELLKELPPYASLHLDVTMLVFLATDATESRGALLFTERGFFTLREAAGVPCCLIEINVLIV